MDTYQPNELLTIAAIRREYGVGRTMLYELIGRGELPAVVIGKRGTRVRRGDIDSWIGRLPQYNSSVYKKDFRGPTRVAKTD